MSRQISTLIGVSALLLWSTLVGLLRLSTESLMCAEKTGGFNLVN
ncbi:hypothetical protein [Acinetobacter baumannii]|nr:hypothetical protein [Acinetobacter baumannii]MCT6572565.1 hypothetical protein [Acinetobacter baumannii]MCT6577340.1 hypothetical protein [Acinetobacter baumannii]MCT6599665.1 hypothetical protein [Acinetobacter baumannii]MCT6602696.1 hypothetical protein [Acinetobacter baumannii]MCT6609957.1 hypothetical protein [Acinetobacter baumannii]